MGTAGAKVKPKRQAMYQCQECGRRFYSTKAAERASYGDKGCSGCGGADIDIFVSEADSRTRFGR